MKIRVRNSLFMGVVLFSLIFLLGCGTLETLINKEGTATSLGDFIGGDKTATLPAASTASASADSREISLYFADGTGKYLVEEQRTLPKTLSLARETVTQWLKGPAVSSGTTVQAAVPTTTMLLDIAIKENVVIVDLSKEFLQPNSKVSSEVALYGLVNTLTQFSTIKQVQIRVEGKPLTKYGTIDATNLVNKANLVKGGDSTDINANPITPSPGTKNKGSGVSTSEKTSNGALPDSPSSINLFNYPPSST
ncbi:GerMN domain-containing protein [Desulfosporosinus sp. OT]|uniref:GerMN domain-containing protein n=1 Tax=Desulfosporosinus sp. OT TaxID=913865 RepID=UPI0002E92416|nr:GerMN domain-containing protein [Desulfosporosinus sp. OT]